MQKLQNGKNNAKGIRKQSIEFMEIPDFLKASFGTKGLPNKLILSEAAKKRIQKNRSYLENKINSGDTYYGINTGFGSLCNVRIANEDLSQLQENLVCSHACGLGNSVPKELVKLMLLFYMDN